MKIKNKVKYIHTAQTAVGDLGDIVKLDIHNLPLLVVGYTYRNNILMTMVVEFKMSKYMWLSKVRVKLVLIRYILGL